MKKSSALLIVATLMLTACGAATQIASKDNGQKFQDGIYNNTPAFRTKSEKAESESETRALIEKTKESPIYLFGDKKDTVMIPHDMSATIRYDQKLGGTVVTVGENPYDWRYDLENNYGYWYGPYSIGSSWYWSRHYNPWYSWSYSPWTYRGWYDPWYYGGWYSSWYYGGWHDPWYYGGWYGWFDPWYYGAHWHHHHYAGWYGGWDPYWNYGHGPGYDMPENNRKVYSGPRHQTGSDKVFSSGSSLRGGGGRTSTVSRNSTISSGTSTRSERVTTNRSSVVRTTPSVRGEANAPTRGNTGVSTAARPSAGVAPGSPATGRRPASAVSGSASTGRQSGTTSRTGVQSNHRRPAATISGNSGSYNSGSQISTGRTPSATRTSPGYERSSSSYERSSSSYSRSSSPSTRSSYSSGSSGGSSGRSSYSGGGGGYSRSGGTTRR